MKRDAALLWLWNAIRLTLGFLFLLAAAGKLRDPIKFMGGMDQYQLVHGWTTPLGAAMLPGAELLAALLLLIGHRVRPAAMIISGQLLIFIYAMGSALYRKLELDCGCFDLMGADPSLMDRAPWMRDLMLTGLVLAFHFLSTESVNRGRPRLWRGFLGVALFTWLAFSLLAAGAPAWHHPLKWLLIGAAALFLAFDLIPNLGKVHFGLFARDVLVLGPPVWLIFHVLGSGAATLGWGTIFRDVAMLLPALWIILYRPLHGGETAAG